MKFILLSAIAAISLSSSAAFADGFELIKDNKKYWCEESISDPGNAARCAEKAYRGPFTREESIRICSGARNEGPADCAIAAYRGPFTREESVQLCERNGSLERAECAIQAYRGPYSREEAIRLCRGTSAPQLLLRSLQLVNGARDLEGKVRDIKKQLPLE